MRRCPRRPVDESKTPLMLIRGVLWPHLVHEGCDAALDVLKLSMADVLPRSPASKLELERAIETLAEIARSARADREITRCANAQYIQAFALNSYAHITGEVADFKAAADILDEAVERLNWEKGARPAGALFDRSYVLLQVAARTGTAADFKAVADVAADAAEQFGEASKAAKKALLLKDNTWGEALAALARPTNALPRSHAVRRANCQMTQGYALLQRALRTGEVADFRKSAAVSAEAAKGFIDQGTKWAALARFNQSAALLEIAIRTYNKVSDFEACADALADAAKWVREASSMLAGSKRGYSFKNEERAKVDKSGDSDVSVVRHDFYTNDKILEKQIAKGRAAVKTEVTPSGDFAEALSAARNASDEVAQQLERQLAKARRFLPSELEDKEALIQDVQAGIEELGLKVKVGGEEVSRLFLLRGSLTWRLRNGLTRGFRKYEAIVERAQKPVNPLSDSPSEDFHPK